MSMNVEDIESAIAQLPRSDLAELSTWFEGFMSGAWDEQIEEDIRAGSLDNLAQTAQVALIAREYKSHDN